MGIQNSLQDNSRDVPLSPGVWQSMPPPCGNRIEGMVGDQEAELDLERADLKRFLDLNELKELRNDAYLNSKIKKEISKKMA